MLILFIQDQGHILFHFISIYTEFPQFSASPLNSEIYLDFPPSFMPLIAFLPHSDTSTVLFLFPLLLPLGIFSDLSQPSSKSNSTYSLIAEVHNQSPFLRGTKLKGITYVYFRIPSNFEVQIITLLSAEPDAKRLPRN